MKTIKTRGSMPVFDMQLLIGAKDVQKKLATTFNLDIVEVQEIASRMGGDDVLFGLVEIDKKPFGLFYLDPSKRNMYDTGIHLQTFSQYFTILKGGIIPHLFAGGCDIDEDSQEELEYQAWELAVGVDATTGQIGRAFGISDYEAALWLGEEMSNTSLALVSIDDKPFVIFVLNEGGEDSLYPRPILSVLLYGLEFSDYSSEIFGAGIDISEEDIEFLEEQAWKMFTSYVLNVFEELDGYVVKPL